MESNTIKKALCAICAPAAFFCQAAWAQSARLPQYDMRVLMEEQAAADRGGEAPQQASAAADERKPALSFTTGLPLLAYSTCSGSPVVSSLWEGPMFLSAKHCLPSRAAGGEAVRGAYASGSVMGVVNPAARALEFYTGRAQYEGIQDFALAPVKGEVSKAARVYRLARAMPRPGEKLTVWGYPTVGIPGLAGAAPLAGMSCAYLGHFLGIAPHAKNEPFTLIHAARCPRKVFIQGMSGGPVLDSAGDVIGTLSMCTAPPKFDVEGSVLLFPEVTEARLNPAFSPENRDFLLPLPDGVKLYSPIYFFAYAPTAAEDAGPGAGELSGRPLVMIRGNFEVPLKHQAVDGVMRAYTDSGEKIDCARYEKGEFAGVVPCE